MSFWTTRKRVPSEPQLTGASIRIAMGDFGDGSPAFAVTEVDPRSRSIYHYHQGDLFAPGSQNWVFEPVFELPINTLWGMGFLRRANTFNPIQPPQVYAQPTLFPNGIGGVVPGEIEFQGLINPDGETPPPSDWAYDSSIK